MRTNFIWLFGAFSKLCFILWLGYSAISESPNNEEFVGILIWKERKSTCLVWGDSLFSISGWPLRMKPMSPEEEGKWNLPVGTPSLWWDLLPLPVVNTRQEVKINLPSRKQKTIPDRWVSYSNQNQKQSFIFRRSFAASEAVLIDISSIGRGT